MNTNTEKKGKSPAWVIKFEGHNLYRVGSGYTFSINQLKEPNQKVESRKRRFIQ